MKVVFSFQSNNSSKPQKQNVAFGAGLMPEFEQAIRNADVLEISHGFAKQGIETDFKGNKFVAWGCKIVINALQDANRRFRAGFVFPSGICVEDFGKLNVDDPMMTGVCNLTPTFLRKNSTEKTPPRTIFFNSFESIPQGKKRYVHSWDAVNVDKSADEAYATKFKSTDFFLERMLHEFSHVIHGKNVEEKIGGKALAAEARSFQEEPSRIERYRAEYGEIMSQICRYAEETDPFEAVACDMTGLFANAFDKRTLMLTRNPLIDTPYENLHFWQPKRIRIPVYSKEKRPPTEIKRDFWNGKFD